MNETIADLMSQPEYLTASLAAETAQRALSAKIERLGDNRSEMVENVAYVPAAERPVWKAEMVAQRADLVAAITTMAHIEGSNEAPETYDFGQYARILADAAAAIEVL